LVHRLLVRPPVLSETAHEHLSPGLSKELPRTRTQDEAKIYGNQTDHLLGTILEKVWMQSVYYLCAHQAKGKVPPEVSFYSHSYSMEA